MERLYTTTEIGKQYAISAKNLNLMLERENVIRKTAYGWELCTSQHRKGLAVVKVTSFVRSDGTPDESRSLKWTETGKAHIENVVEKWFSKVGAE